MTIRFCKQIMQYLPFCVNKRIVILILMLFYHNIFAQKLPFRNYGIKDGLAQSTVYDIFQDSKGYLWFATQSGVSKFDGKTFVNFTTYEGLTDNFVRSILEDQYGNFWFGTSNGISKFDGKIFQNFTSEQGLINNDIWAVLEDQRGNLWFGTMGGLSKLAITEREGSGRIFENYTTQHGLNDNAVRSLFEDKKGNIWIGTDRGVCRLLFKNVENKGDSSPRYGRSFLQGKLHPEQVFEDFSKIHEFYRDLIWSFQEDRKGNLWIGTLNHGVAKFDGKTLQTFTTSHGLIGNSVRCIIEDHNGYLWFGTYTGVSKFSPAGGYSDKKGGVYSVKERDLEQSFENFNIAQGLTNHNIRSLLEDNNGNIWIGTDGGGVAKFSGRYFEQFSFEHGRDENIVFSINEDKYGNILIGTDGAGIYKLTYNNKFAENRFQAMTAFGRSFEGIVILSILKDHNENLWFCDFHGGVTKLILNKRVGYGYTIENYLPGRELPNLFVTSIIEDIVGNIWIGMFGGVTKIVFKDNEKGGNSTPHHVVFENITPENGLVNSEVLSIYEDLHGNIWFCTEGGVSKLTPGNNKEHLIENFTTKQGLAHNYVWCCLEDQKGNMWFGTKGGLSKLSPPKEVGSWQKAVGNTANYSLPTANFFRGAVYTKKDGLKSNAIWLMTMDNEGNIWVGHEKGIEKLIQNDSNETVGFQYYGYLEGFTPMETNANAVFKDSKGNLWFGTLEGVVKYDPKEDRVSITVPRTHITNIRLFGTETDFSTWCDSLDRRNGLPNNLRLPYDKNHLSFDYIGIHYKIPEKVKYQYKLVGFDKNWSESTSVTFATYTNLEPGSYTFKIKACNSDGFWNLNPTRFSFIITPPFWKTGWYYASEILFFTVLIAITFYINKTKTKSRVGTILTFATILFIFEFLNIYIELYVEDYAGGVPIFKLIMNMTLAGSLNPLERLISRFDEYI